MLKRFCDVCGSEIKDREIYFVLTPERCDNEIIAVNDDDMYVEPYIYNHANICGGRFKDIFLRKRYPLTSSERYSWKENK